MAASGREKASYVKIFDNEMQANTFSFYIVLSTERKA